MYYPNEEALDKLPSPELSEEDLKAPLEPNMPLWAEKGRRLTKLDKLLIEIEGGEHAPNLYEAESELVNLTIRHHTVAKYLGAGLSVIEASEMSGYSTAVIRGFVGQPLFQELVAHYERLEESRAAPVVDAMTVLGMQAAQRLMHRIEQCGEYIETSELRNIMSTALDRAGYSPKTRHESVSINMTGAELAEIRKQAAGENVRSAVIIQQPGEVHEEAIVTVEPADTD